MRKFAVLLVLCLPAPAWAGLHYSGEKLAELPAEWRGLLADLRVLRGAAASAGPPNMLRQQYQGAAQALREKGKRGELTPDEAADLGALLIRLGQNGEALGLLRAAQGRHPEHFALAANLGTAWQVQGDLRRAAEQLRLAVRLAPDDKRAAEQLHLRWVLGRLAEPSGQEPLDDLFGLRERKPWPPGALADGQRLAFWFPADGRLLWLLAEMADRLGDRPGAASLLEAAVGEFGLGSPQARRRRAEIVAALADEAKQPLGGAAAQKSAHLAHGASPIVFKSRRPLLVQRFDLKTLGAARKDGVNPAPWGLLAETTLDRERRAEFPAPLKALAGLKVELAGYMQPLGDDLETGLFLLVEQPVGCWFCEMPPAAGVVCVELKPGENIRLTRGPVKVVGTLMLNADDPEDFLFTVKDAKAGVVD